VRHPEENPAAPDATKERERGDNAQLWHPYSGAAANIPAISKMKPTDNHTSSGGIMRTYPMPNHRSAGFALTWEIVLIPSPGWVPLTSLTG
jgi:hypothetical protein